MPLAERLILALEAGQQTGGDKRWGYFQSAAIRVADPNDPGRGGDHLSLSIDVGEHARPVEEMKRISGTAVICGESNLGPRDSPTFFNHDFESMGLKWTGFEWRAHTDGNLYKVWIWEA